MGPAKLREKTESISTFLFLSVQMLVMILSHYFRRLGRRPEERERARKSGIGEDLVADDHDQWMIKIIG